MTKSNKPTVLPSAQIDIGQMSNMYEAPRHYTEKIEHLNSEAPAFDLPPYPGERYERVVPDTFDIAERARLVQHVMTHAVDPQQDYEIYFGVELGRNPPVMTHGSSDLCQRKFLLALPLMRLITGSEELMEVEHSWLEVVFKQFGPDGLTYLPCLPYYEDFERLLDRKQARHFCLPTVTDLPAFVVQYLRNPTDLWRDAIARMIRGIDSVTLDRGDWAYIPGLAFTPGTPRDPKAPVPLGANAVDSMGWITGGLGQWARLTGDPLALKLARKISHCLKDQTASFDSEGRFLRERQPGEKSYIDGVFAHFHSHTLILLNMLEYAIPFADQTLLAFIKQSFEWARTQGEAIIVGARTRKPGAPLGYFPELLYLPSHETSESCEVADMIGLALKLSAAGIGDYWDEADGWIRNQFAENQLTDTRWLHEWTSHLPAAGPAKPGATDVDVIERNRGAFAGWPMPNEWMNHVPEARTQIMHCCTGNGARAIHTIWKHILTYAGGKLRVNLLLNRASAWADVDSFLPAEGRVDIHVKQAMELEVRIPGWVPAAGLHCQINGRDLTPTWQGRYVRIGAVAPGDEVRLAFPVTERCVAIEIQKRRYEVILRGADAVHIDPPGVRMPFYQRDRYRTGTTPMRTASRFATGESIDW